MQAPITTQNKHHSPATQAKSNPVQYRSPIVAEGPPHSCPCCWLGLPKRSHMFSQTALQLGCRVLCKLTHLHTTARATTCSLQAPQEAMQYSCFAAVPHLDSHNRRPQTDCTCTGSASACPKQDATARCLQYAQPSAGTSPLNTFPTFQNRCYTFIRRHSPWVQERAPRGCQDPGSTLVQPIAQ